MLEFFRKYQSYIFIVVTFVIIISFSFFGTYSSIVSNPVRDQVVFTAVDGENISRHELDEMVMFISTDNYDKQFFGGSWGPNFLNDGVIRKDLIATGIANLLAEQYLGDLKPDLDNRLLKEKAYRLYQHPQANFIGPQSVWAVYAPKINENLKALQNLKDAATEKGMDTRIKLFTAEMNFPPNYLRYMLTSQEKQSKFISHDPSLDRMDLSLFGYHTVEDWFGPRFVRLSAQFIINSAKIAEQKGYKVSKEEALADLIRNSQISYNQNINNPNIGVVNSNEYYNEQFRLLGMDQNQAVKVWQQVLLFRRLFQDVGTSVFEGSLVDQQLNQYAEEVIDGEVYSLPKEMQLSDLASLQKFEIYLNQISKRSDEDVKNLKLPTTFLSITTLSKRNPEFVQKRYLVRVSEANKKNLISKASLKDTWNFEVDHWDQLVAKFPELGIKKAVTNEERFKILDDLDEVTRSRVDLFARNEIVESHPEWLNEALQKVRERTVVISLSKKGNNSFFEGLSNGEELMNLLENQEKDTALRFTADNQHHYLITVLEKSPNEEILTFPEADRAGILDLMLDGKLKAYYQKNKEAKNWKSYDEVKDLVAEEYSADALNTIAKQAGKEKVTPREAATLRFYGMVKENLELLKKNQATSINFISLKNEDKSDKSTQLPVISTPAEQWKMHKEQVALSRKDDLKNNDLFKLQPNSWTDIITAPNGEVSFFYVKEKKAATVEPSTKMISAQSLLSNAAEKNYMKKVIAKIKDDHAISLDYLNQPIETMVPHSVQD